MKRKDIPELSNISSYKYENIFDVHEQDGYYFYNLYNSIIIQDDISPSLYDEHSFVEGDYWTKLALQYWGNMELWWVILVTNKIQNPLELPPFGTKLKILKSNVVSDIISEMIRNG